MQWGGEDMFHCAPEEPSGPRRRNVRGGYAENAGNTETAGDTGTMGTSKWINLYDVSDDLSYNTIGELEFATNTIRRVHILPAQVAV